MSHAQTGLDCLWALSGTGLQPWPPVQTIIERHVRTALGRSSKPTHFRAL